MTYSRITSTTATMIRRLSSTLSRRNLADGAQRGRGMSSIAFTSTATRRIRRRQASPMNGTPITSRQLTSQATDEKKNKKEDDIRHQFIFGRWLESSDSRDDSGGDASSSSTPQQQSQTVENPSNQQTLTRIPQGTAQDAEWALKAAEAVQPTWQGQVTAAQRGALLQQLANTMLVGSNKTALATAIAKEQGVTMALAEAEVEASAEYLRYCASSAMAGTSAAFQGSLVQSSSSNEQIQLHRSPRGVVVGLFLSSNNMNHNLHENSNPWPLRGLIQVLGPALATGNTLVLRPSAPYTALALAELLDQADIIPPGVVNIVVGNNNDATLTNALVDNSIASYIRCTSAGSLEEEDAILQSVLTTAAKRAIPISLQTGGFAPAIVLDDCDLEATVQHLWSSRTLFSAGQWPCYTPQPIYVDASSSSFYDDFVQALVERVKQTKVGASPFDKEKVDMCGLMHATQLHKLAAWVQQAKNGGANVETGGNMNSLMPSGYHYEPTVLTDLPKSMRQEQVLGPVWSIVKLESKDELQEILFQGNVGASASLFTTNAAILQKAMHQAKVKTLFINGDTMPSMHGYHADRLGGSDGELGMVEYTSTRCTYWNTIPETK